MGRVASWAAWVGHGDLVSGDEVGKRSIGDGVRVGWKPGEPIWS